jgi:hypothetical protein
MVRRIAWVLALVVLLTTGALGVYNGATEWRDAQTGLQLSVALGVLLYGIFGLTTAYGLFQSRRWSRWSAVLWGVILTYVAATAALAFAPDAASSAVALTSGVASALVAAAVLWTVWIWTRRGAAPSRAPKHTSPNE